MSRQVNFKYYLYDKDNRFKKELKNVLSASVNHAAFAQIKRTAKFTIMDVGDIDYLNDRIKVEMQVITKHKAELVTDWAFVTIQHPVEYVRYEYDESKGDHIQTYPLGIFMIVSPTRYDVINKVRRDLDAYDLSIILRDDKVEDRFFVDKDSDYYAVITDLLKSSGIKDYNIELTENKVPRNIEYDIGTSKLTIVNDLLTQLGYTPIHVDEAGVFVSYPYVSPSDRPPTHSYKDDRQSVILVGAEEELDLSEAYNVFTVVRTNAEEEPLVSTVINDDPDNPLSTVNRGRRIVDYREVEDIADQQALDNYTKNIANEANFKYGRIRFNTALMPTHGYSDVIDFEYSDLGIKGKFLEINWEMQLEVGGVMSHELRTITNFSKEG